MNILLTALLLIASAFASTSHAATQATTEQHDGETYYVLENDKARIAVLPIVGATITQYLDKRSGVDFCTGPVTRDRPGLGWKSITRLNYAAPASDWFRAQPYECELVDGDGYKAIIATCRHGYIEARREMRLADDSTHLTVIVSHTNISSEPQTIYLRWQPYMKLDDVYARSSAILAPGPGPKYMRRVRVGAGWDMHLQDVPGYTLAANYKTGVGIWHTFKKDDAAIAYTWTDYKYSHHPRRGRFTIELFPKPTRVQPGESVTMHCAYQPFVKEDTTEDLKRTFIADEDMEGATYFASHVRENLHTIVPHTMVPSPNNGWTAEQQNRFFFSHRRRDRFALTEKGIVDAMMSIAATQDKPIRTRLFVSLFDDQPNYQAYRFELKITDVFGNVAKEKTWQYGFNPNENQTLDLREDLPIDDLPDGRYTLTLSAYERGTKTPLHTYTEERNFVGGRINEVHAAHADVDSKSLIDQERPFVTALRTVDLPKDGVLIGVEEANGKARTDWPLRLGVPFPKGEMKPTEGIVLLDDQGKATATQTDVMATWRDGSVKWLQVDFQGNVQGSNHTFYKLQKAPSKPARANIAKMAGNSVKIDTGKKQLTISPDDTALLGLLPKEKIWYATADGTQYHLQIKGDEAGIDIVENGPLRGVVRIVGWYFAEGNSKPIARGELRAEFYRGKSWYRLSHTVTYAGDPWVDKLGSMGAQFQLTKSPSGSIELDSNSIAHGDTMSLYQLDDKNASVSVAGKQIESGQHASGAAAIGKTNVYFREMWKYFPKQVDVNPSAGTLTYHYWPKDAGGMNWRPREDGWLPSSSSMAALAVGASRTAEFVIDEDGTFEQQDLEPYFAEPMAVLTPPRYLTSTDALMHVQPYDPENVPQLERLLSSTFDTYLLNQKVYGFYGQWKYGSLPNMYLLDENRWADYGRYAHILNEQDICHTPWLAYLRSGDRKYLLFAEANTKHLMEVATIRLSEHWPKFAGLSRRHHECIWLSFGDYGHSMLDPFLELYHVMGNRVGFEAAERMAAAMAEQRTGEWRYIANPTAGLSRMYLETQKPFYKQHADRIWNDLCAPDRNTWFKIDHGSRMAMYYSQLNEDCYKAWLDIANRPDGERHLVTLDALAVLHKKTGDIKYAKMAAQRFEELRKNAVGNNQDCHDPMRCGINTHTQHILAALREMTYASDVIAAGQEEME